MKSHLLSILSLFFFSSLSHAGEVEVLHWWTSGGEAQSVQKLQSLLKKKGHNWKDFAVAGGGGTNAMTVLKSRAISGNPPTAAQVKGKQIQNWASQGFLANLDSVAKAGKWDQLIPTEINQIMKYKGKYVAVPVNVHRTNWLWVNLAIFKKVGAKIPTTWKEFEVAAEKIRKAGYIPLAFGGQDWQEATVFESIVLGIGGPAFYKKAFVDLDNNTLKSDKMIECLEFFRGLKKYTDENAPGRDWNLATSMVYQGKAAMQIMGDWAKAEFSVAGKKPGVDYDAVPVPGTGDGFLFNVDSFIMFKVKNKANSQAQKELAEIILSDEFQIDFNVRKGSIPVKKGITSSKLDKIAKLSMKHFISSTKRHALLPSIAHEMATTAAVRGAFLDAVTNFYNSNITAKKAALNLANGVKSEMN